MMEAASQQLVVIQKDTIYVAHRVPDQLGACALDGLSRGFRWSTAEHENPTLSICRLQKRHDVVPRQLIVLCSNDHAMVTRSLFLLTEAALGQGGAAIDELKLAIALYRLPDTSETFERGGVV